MAEDAVTISARICEGLAAVTGDGNPAQFAIVDEYGRAIASGPQVAQSAWQTSINAYRRFLMAQGHLRVMMEVQTLAESRQSTFRGSIHDNAVTISALSWEGLSAFAPDGKKAQFAIADQDGRIVAIGKTVAEAAWNASVNAYRQFLIERGHLRILTKPDGFVTESD